tara:strand:- start:1276 stop:1488 length:213 start_codon:yes stop_codon:yes gene_type:complete
MMDINEAIEYAAKNLKGGSRVIITIERHGYGVDLERDISNSSTETIGMIQESIVDDVIHAVDFDNGDIEE